jgi:hypothetical protein
MKRTPEILPLSHDHHHALDVARRLRRANPDTLPAVREYLDTFWVERGEEHFAAEERMLTPDVVDSDAWRDGVARMLDEHEQIRALAVGARDVGTAHALGDLLHDHVRFEERELFPLYLEAAWERSTYTSS